MNEIEIEFDGDLNILKGKTVEVICTDEYIDVNIELPKGEINEESVDSFS